MMDAVPTAEERRLRYARILMTVGELADKRKRAREARRRWRARAQTEYLAGMVKAGKKPRVWRNRGMSARMHKALGVSPLM
jgi:hypothetical protein